MLNAIKGRDDVIRRLAETESKKRDEQEELDKSLSEATREAARHLKLLGLSKDLNRNWQPSFETT